MEAVREIRPHIEQLEQTHKQAKASHLAAKRRYDLAEADAFLKAKKDGATDEMAKRIALIKASDLKAEVDDLAAEYSSARLGSEAWQRVMEFYAALSHSLNREIKLAMQDSPR